MSEGELQRDSVVAKFAYTADDGKNTMFRWAELTFTPYSTAIRGIKVKLLFKDDDLDECCR